MNELDRKISELLVQKAFLKLELNSSYGSTITMSPSKASLDLCLINFKLQKLIKIRDRRDKLDRITKRIKNMNNG